MPPLTGGHAVFEDNNEDMAKRAACRRGRGFQARGTKTGTRRMPNDQNPSKKEASQQIHHGSSSAHTPASEPASPKPAAAPDAASPEPARIYIKEVEGHQARYRKLIQLTHSVHQGRRRHAPRRRRRARARQHGGATRCLLAFWPTLRSASSSAACHMHEMAHRARHQRHLHGGVLPARRPRDQVRDDGGRADEHSPGVAPHRGGCAAAWSRLSSSTCAFNGGNPDTVAWMGRADRHRHRLRARHHGASGQPRAQRACACSSEHAGRGRRHHRHPGHRHLLRPQRLRCSELAARRGGGVRGPR